MDRLQSSPIGGKADSRRDNLCARSSGIRHGRTWMEGPLLSEKPIGDLG